MSPPAFRRDLTDALVERFAPGRQPSGGQPTADHTSRTRGLRSAFRSLIRTPVSRYLDRRVATEMDRVVASLGSVDSSPASQLVRRIEGLEINTEMLKAEVRAVNHNLGGLQRSFDAMAAAIAPTAGIDGVPDRLAELRERLNAVERRTRGMGSARSAAVAGDVIGSSKNDAATVAPPASPIDYVGFERRFRGDPDRVQQITRERYLEVLRDCGPVLDVGCGKGELVGALKEAGVAATGIDLDPAMVDEAQAQGLDVHVADLNSFLESRPPASYGAIISTQVVEHLQIADLVRFLELSASRLVGGGLFIAETPNPTSLIVLGTHFILDPTHVRPIHPALMAYLCECAGFRSVELRYYEPASQYHLSMVDEREAPQWARQLNANFTRINDVLFGPQDYAVVARTAP